MTQTPVDNVLSKLRNVKRAGSNWHASCPCRVDDDNPSLSVKEGDDGRVLLSCHYGSPCNVNQICEAMNIKVKDLYPPEKQTTAVTAKRNKLVKAYPYCDEEGVLLFEKLRYVTEDGKKTFRQRRPDPSNPTKYLYDLDGVRKVLYNLPAVVKAVKEGEPVWIVEGEKDADTLIKMGITATTTTLGAGSWEAEHTRPLIGAYIEIIADNDKPGIEHAIDVATKLRAAGCTVNTWVSKDFKDISDHIGAGKKFDELHELGENGEIVEPDLASDYVKTVRDKMLDVFKNNDLDDSQVFARLAVILGNAPSETKRVDDGRLVKWSEFIKEEIDESYQWVIPGVIEKQERVIVVAAEGVGKTMLARQVAICCAAGIHPFTYQRMPRVRTLTVDLENPERIIKRTSSKIMAAAIGRGFVDDVDAHLLIKPDGLDLCSKEDRAMLEAHIERVKPELICMGPLYKSFIDSGTRTSEALAIEVARYLDQIRDVYGCALWLEHHAPLGSMGSRDLRPFGSSVWSRWPEFGLALQPDPTALEGFVYEVRHFRGARDVREWPTKMKRGTLFPFEVLEFMKVD